MFESLTTPEDAIVILKNDHAKVKDLFDRFEKADSLREKKKLVAEAVTELKIHAELEEKIFYATVRPQLEKKVMNEADEEHHVAKMLIAELDVMDGTEDHYCAKFIVLAENIRHHIREEESHMLPEARKLDINFSALGLKMLALKKTLLKNGVPPSDESKLVSRRGIADSPAKAAKTRRPVKLRKPAAKVLPVKKKKVARNNNRKPARRKAG